MPHDRRGNVLQKGDIVSVPCRVLEIYEGEEFCNLSLVTLEKMPPYQEGTMVTLNTRQVELEPVEVEPEASVTLE